MKTATALRISICLAIAMCGCGDTTDVHNMPDVWSVEISVIPQKALYAIGETVQVDYLVRDHLGREIGGIGASWEDPASQDVLPLSGREFQFTRKGFFTWKVTLEAPYNLTTAKTLSVQEVPASVAIAVEPETDLYATSDRVTVSARVFSQSGERIEGLATAWVKSAPPMFATRETGISPSCGKGTLPGPSPWLTTPTSPPAARCGWTTTILPWRSCTRSGETPSSSNRALPPASRWPAGWME